MKFRISVVIPNRNGEKTIGLCLEALSRSAHNSFEVIVVDDASTDNSISIIEKYPCTLIKMKQQVGASAARNIGAQLSSGTLLFFTDADCLVYEDTLSRAEGYARHFDADTVIGGTYTPKPYDKSFYSSFQSIFIHYCELKNTGQPDYIAAHAMVIPETVFRESGGFPVDFLPIIEDVEFSHRLRKKGYRLVMMPELQVRHIFGFRGMADSIRNGYMKSKFWTVYSLGNKDLLTDSGTASIELKMNVLALFVSLTLAAAHFLSSNGIFLILLAALIVANLSLNLKLFSFFNRTGTKIFLIAASLYYMLIYPFAVGAGALAGIYNFYMLQEK